MFDFDLSTQKKIHFIGIGGISMSAIAHILLTGNHRVSGSDSHASALTEELETMGAIIYIGQRASNISPDVDAVVYTAAIGDDNPELKAARDMGILTVTRADFLGLLMKNYPNAICISGTHGKTTTTSLISQIFLDMDTDPTIMVGGILPSIGGNTRIGHSGNFITEACEYTNSFHSFFPTTEVVLNVKADHLDFFKDLDDIRNSFRTYTHLLPEQGSLVINGEIDDLDFFTEGLPCKVVTFGLHGDFDLTARNISYNTAYPSYDLYCAGEYICPVTLHIPGEHNVYNSLAALGVCQSLGMDLIKAAECMEHFHGVDRRFQFKGSLGGVTVIDDYAHHPDEIQATLSAATDLPHRKLWVVFQPHTYTRTQAFLPEFAQALSEADHVVLAEIYAAREKNELGISSADLQKLIQEKGVPCEYFPTFDEIENFLLENCTDGDVLITMGAGDVVNIGNSLLGL